MASTGRFSTFSREFCWPSRAKGIIVLISKRFIHHYKILTGNNFGLILKKKMAAMGSSLSVIKTAYISLIIGPKGLVCEANLYEIMGWESSDVVTFDLGPLLQGPMRRVMFKSAYNSLDWFGLDGTVLLWIKSYLSNRKHKIKIGDSFSEAVILPFGVPQGSVLGPLLFTLYTSPLSQVISKFNVTHHLYADDTQIYLAVDSRNFDSSIEELTKCLRSIQEWMVGVKLKLNPEKNEFIIIGQKAIRESLAPNFPVPLLQNNISPSVEVKNLGVIFDSDNSFDNHVAKICRACYYHLRDLRRIRKFLSDETAILLANAMVSSRLDYCNSLLYGVSKSNIAKLQRVQNALCRIIFRLDKMSHVTTRPKKHMQASPCSSCTS